MTRHRQGIWLNGLLMLSLVGCTTLSPSKPPAPQPKVEVTTEAPKPPEPVAPPPAPPPAEAKKEIPVAQAPPAQPPAPRPPSPPAAPPPRPSARFVVLNFDNADIEVVIHAVSEIVGFNYLLAILEVHGFTAVKSDTLYKIIKLEGARERPVPTVVGAVPDPGRVGDEIITQIVPIRFASVAELSGLLRQMMPARGSLIPHLETNLLIITDSASNIRRLLDIVKLVDVEVALEELQIIPVKHTDAQELAQILNQIFAPGRRLGAPAVPAALPTPAAPPTPARPATDGTTERPPLIRRPGPRPPRRPAPPRAPSPRARCASSRTR